MRKFGLFPRYLKWIGLILFVSTFFVFPLEQDLDYVHEPLGFWVQVMSFSGLLFIAGAALRIEDEWTQMVRLNCIKAAILIYMLVRIGMKAVAFYLEDVSWLPENFQVNMLLIMFILFFYSRMKLVPFIQEKFLNK